MQLGRTPTQSSRPLSSASSFSGRILGLFVPEYFPELLYPKSREPEAQSAGYSPPVCPRLFSLRMARERNASSHSWPFSGCAVQVSAALRSAAGKALGDVDDEHNTRHSADAGAAGPSGKEERSPECSSGRSVAEVEEREGRKLTGDGEQAGRASPALYVRPILVVVAPTFQTFRAELPPLIDRSRVARSIGSALPC